MIELLSSGLLLNQVKPNTAKNLQLSCFVFGVERDSVKPQCAADAT